MNDETPEDPSGPMREAVGIVAAVIVAEWDDPNSCEVTDEDRAWSYVGALKERPDLLLHLVNATDAGKELAAGLWERMIVAAPQHTFALLAAAEQVTPAGRVAVADGAGRTRKAPAAELVWRTAFRMDRLVPLAGSSPL